MPEGRPKVLEALTQCGVSRCSFSCPDRGGGVRARRERQNGSAALVAVVDPSLPIQPLLQAAAQLDAKSTVRVIIQKANPLADSSVIAKSAKGKVVENFSVIPAFTADLKLGDVLALATNPDVRYVSLDAVVKQKSPVDTSQLTTTYPQDVAAPAVWNATSGTGATGLGVTVAVIDTGLDLSHPDFHGNVSAVNVNAAASGTKGRLRARHPRRWDHRRPQSQRTVHRGRPRRARHRRQDCRR